MVIVDQSGTIVLVNGQAEKLFGYRREEMLDKPIEILVPERYRRQHQSYRGGYFAHPQVREMGDGLELFGLRKDGSEFPVEIRLSPVETDQGRLVSNAIRDVTQRKRLEQSQALLGSIVESSQDAIIGKTLQGIITSWNKGAERLFGYRAEEIIGQSVSRLIPEERLEEEMQILARLGRGERIDHYETVRRRKDGRLIHVSLTVSPIRDGSGRLIGVSKIARDITERREAEEKLRESEERFRELAENIDEVFWLADVEVRSIIYISPAYERVWGRSCESLRKEPRSFLDAIHPEDRPRVLDAINARTKTAVPYELEYRVLRPDGAVRWISDRCFPILSAAGSVYRFGGIAHDITRRKQTEEQLVTQRRQLEEAQALARLGSWNWDILTNILTCSDELYRVFGLTREEFGATHEAFLKLAHPEDRVQLEAVLRGGLRGDRPYECDVRILRPDRSVRVLHTRGQAICDQKGKPLRMFGTAQDITERRQLEMQLRQAQKMEGIGQLAGGMAHDFNNLLLVISGHSELLAIGLPSDDRSLDSIAEIRRATELATASIRQLLAFSRRQILEPKVLDLNSVVAEAEKMLRRLIGENVHLASLLQPRLSPVRADLGQLNQVILNLALNSCDAMPQGGSLTLETHEVDLDEADAKAHPDLRPGRYVLLTVTDTGCGMTPEVQARILEPFFTTKNEGHGTGLGLSVVLGIVQQSGGLLDVESNPGAGTKFKIYLPAAQEPAEGPAQSAPSKLIGGSEIILLVEDEAPVRVTAGLMLKALGYRVLQAASGEEALRLFEVSREKIGLLMTDVVMPGMSGPQVAEALRARDPDLRVLFQSGYTDDTVVRWGILHAEVDFLKKPFTLDVLARKVREMLDRPAAC